MRRREFIALAGSTLPLPRSARAAAVLCHVLLVARRLERLPTAKAQVKLSNNFVRNPTSRLMTEEFCENIVTSLGYGFVAWQPHTHSTVVRSWSSRTTH